MSYLLDGLGAGSSISQYVLDGLNPGETVLDTTRIVLTGSYQPATEQTIRYFTGEDKRLIITVMRGPELTSTQNMIGWSLSFMVKRRKRNADADALFEKTNASGIDVTLAAVGEIEVAISDDDIDLVSGDTLYYHELKRVDAGYETVLMYGQFLLNQAVHE